MANKSGRVNGHSTGPPQALLGGKGALCWGPKGVWVPLRKNVIFPRVVMILPQIYRFDTANEKTVWTSSKFKPFMHQRTALTQ